MARKKRTRRKPRARRSVPEPVPGPPSPAESPASQRPTPASPRAETARKRVVIMDLPYGRIRQWELSRRAWQWTLAGLLAVLALSLTGLALGGWGLWHWRITRRLQRENQALRRDLAKTLALKAELQRVEHLRRRILYLLGVLTDTTDSAVLQYMAHQMDEAQATPRGWPLRGLVTRRFSDLHPGMDIACPEGTPVRATAPGIVAYAGPDSLYGKLVVIRHPGGYETLYGHLSRLLVIPGWRVQRGDLIGFSGNTGISTGPHLHYAIRKDGRPVDPSPFLVDTSGPEDFP